MSGCGAFAKNNPTRPSDLRARSSASLLVGGSPTAPALRSATHRASYEPSLALVVTLRCATPYDRCAPRAVRRLRRASNDSPLRETGIPVYSPEKEPGLAWMCGGRGRRCSGASRREPMWRYRAERCASRTSAARTTRRPRSGANVGLSQRTATGSVSERSYVSRCEAQRSTGTRRANHKPRTRTRRIVRQPY